jgi:GT2 family glycosyltransferase
MAAQPAASIVVPTRRRAGYLDVALASIVPQAGAATAEVIVVSDGPDAGTEAVARRHGARLIELGAGSGANVARNAGAQAARAELLVFVDDDIEALPGWLDALLGAARAAPGHDVFGGPIEAKLEGGGPRACGRESAPITTLDLGPADCDAGRVWSANMAVRAGALRRVGPFDPRFAIRGDEEDWLWRYAAQGGRIRYVAAARVRHRRTAEDARLRRLTRAAYAQGRAARRYDVSHGKAPGPGGELRVLVGCVWHIVRRRCAIGVVMLAQAAGRVAELLAPVAVGAPPGEDFLSGVSGHVGGPRRTASARVADAADALAILPRRASLRSAAVRGPRRRVLVLSVERTDVPNLLDAARAELSRSRHDVFVAVAEAAGGGKFENLNALLERHPARGHDWLLVLDDDVALPSRFLDTFLLLAERFDLALAQPAHRHLSHAAWAVTRRRRGSLARETAFVEIGPVVAFHARTFDTLLPFPPLRAGWGLDSHWSAVAAEHGWRIGVVDATPVQHIVRPVAAGYDRSAAVAEARRFLTGRPYVRAADAQRTLATHRRL